MPTAPVSPAAAVPVLSPQQQHEAALCALEQAIHDGAGLDVLARLAGRGEECRWHQA